MRYHLLLLIFMAVFFTACSNSKTIQNDDIVFENEQIKLVIQKDGLTKSLIFKPKKEECLITTEKFPIFSIIQERPYHNEIKLSHPNKKMKFNANSIKQEGDKLIVGFELIPYRALVKVNVTSDYIGFSIEDFLMEKGDYNINISHPPVFEMNFLQLAVRDRKYFGEWLNVSWDDNIAVNVLATDPYARIDSEKRQDFRILSAGVEKVVKLKGVGAALIVCETEKLLDKIARVEEDFNLPKGVESRRHKMYNASYYWSADVNPGNIDKHLKYAKMAGFRTFMIYYPAFIESVGYRKLGNYDWNRSVYPNGKDDLIKLLNKIKDEGMIPGFHFLHSHIGRDSKYITPEADHRLNLLKIFTLARPLSKNDTVIYVEQNPDNLTMAPRTKVLKIGPELISYENYTTTEPYKFTGCIRGIDNTTINAQPTGYMFGLLDVSEFGSTSVYIDQNTSLQDEIAEKLADIYDAGFRFLYFDGSEGVNAPFWFHVSSAQWKVFKRLKPEPIFAEGAAKTHFSWHMLTGGNAFDAFRPEYQKEAIRKWPAEQAPRMRADFTRVNFGWLRYYLPDDKTIGTQPDILEYVTSRAAAWDCPVSLHANLYFFDKHPRTADNMEVFRRWEEVRLNKRLTNEQKLMLQNVNQEHIMLLDENNEFELQAYDQIDDVAGGSREVRAFIFNRNKNWYAVYWHISDDKNLVLPLDEKKVTLYEKLGQSIPVKSDSDNNITIPVSKRRYLKTIDLSRDELISAFKNAKIIN